MPLQELLMVNEALGVKGLCIFIQKYLHTNSGLQLLRAWHVRLRPKHAYIGLYIGLLSCPNILVVE